MMLTEMTTMIMTAINGNHIPSQNMSYQSSTNDDNTGARAHPIQIISMGRTVLVKKNDLNSSGNTMEFPWEFLGEDLFGMVEIYQSGD